MGEEDQSLFRHLLGLCWLAKQWTMLLMMTVIVVSEAAKYNGQHYTPTTFGIKL